MCWCNAGRCLGFVVLLICGFGVWVVAFCVVSCLFWWFWCSAYFCISALPDLFCLYLMLVVSVRHDGVW